MEMTKRQLVVSVVFMLLGLAVAGLGAYRRILTDAEYRSVMLLVDWQGLVALPSVTAETTPTDGLDRPDLWQLMKALPGARICYAEETIISLMQQGIIQRADVPTEGPAFVVCAEQFERDIYQGAQRHGYWIERSDATDGKLVFQVPLLPGDDLMMLPVAWRQDVIEACRTAGYEPVLRPGGTEYLGKAGLQRTLEFCNGQDFVLFNGPQVLGYPGELDQVAKQLGERQQYFGWVEFDEQSGGGGLAAKALPNVLRVHSIPVEELEKYTVEGAIQRLIRAVRERSIRCLYIRPLAQGTALAEDGGTGAEGYRSQMLAINQRYFKSLASALEIAGFEVMDRIDFVGGPPSSPRPAPHWLKQARPLLVLATGAALAWLLALWMPGAPRWLWTVLLSASLLVAMAAAVVPQVLEFGLFAAAIVFPLLGFWLALNLYQRLAMRWSCKPDCTRRLFLALAALVVASAVTAVGGLIIHSGMWDVSSILKTVQFRGVTLALAIPILVVAAYAWQAETLQDTYHPETRALSGYWQRLLTLWQAPIRYGDIALIFIALGAVGVVLLRSGNDSPLDILSLEAWMRQGLEQLLVVRPRTKELLGHPLLVLFFLSLPWRNRLGLLLVLGGMLGQVSILNTFCHLHTPLLLTLERVGLGLGIGLASGLIWGGLVLLASWIIRLATAKIQRTPAARPGN